MALEHEEAPLEDIRRDPQRFVQKMNDVQARTKILDNIASSFDSLGRPSAPH